MADLPNRADLFTVGRRAVRTAPNVRISPEVVDVAGSDINLILGAGSIMGEAIVAALASCTRGNFIDSAVDEQLDKVMADRFNLQRKSAEPAHVDLTFSRATFAAGAGAIPAGTTVRTAAGTAFTTDVEQNFGATDLVITGVAATATTTGPEGNVDEGLVTVIADPLFDGTIGVSNSLPAAGGANRETNAQFRARGRQYFATIRRGVIGAIVQAGIQTQGVAVATAFEITNPFGVPAAAVQLVVADANGNTTGGILQAVRNNLLEFRACGIPVNVVGGTVSFENVIWQGLEFATGTNTQQIQADVRAVTAAVTQFLSPGSKLLRSTLIAAAKLITGLIVPDGALAEPAGDVVPPSNDVLIRVRPADVSFT